MESTIANLATVAASGANFAVNSVISPRYSKMANKDRAPGQPAPVFFSIWTPIFLGQMTYGFLKSQERSKEASFWNLMIAASGFTYAYTLVSKRFYSMQAAMGAMSYATFMYRRALPISRTPQAKFVKFTAELCVGWPAAANLIVASQNIRRLQKSGYSETEANAIGATETLALTAASVAANRVNGWNGVSAASLWALTGIVFDQRSRRSVRMMAGVGALGVIADFLDVRAKREAAKPHALPRRKVVFEEVVTIEL